MRIMPFIALLLVLVNCSTPSRYFAESAVTQVTMGGNDFDVRVRGNLVETIRTNSTYAPRMGAVRQQAVAAMEVVSGCDVIQVLGDQAVQLGQLDCDGSKTPPRLIVPPPRYDCLETPTGISAGDGWEYVDFDCKPYWQ